MKQKTKENCSCKKCKSYFMLEPDETWWDDKGYGYSTKLCKCPICSSVVILNYSFDQCMDVNFDERFYNYSR